MERNRSTWLGIALAAMALGTALTPNATRGAESKRPIYGRPFEAKKRPALLPLPPGAVEPAGWLRDWCIAARDGYTGHMDDYDVAFRQAWAADFRQKGEGLYWYKGAWPYEGGGYWFDGLARLGLALHDDALIGQAKARLDPVLNNMNDRGLLFLWWLDRSDPGDRAAVKAALEGWPLWTCGLLGRALSGYYAGTGDRRVLDAMIQAYGADPDGLRSITGNVSNLWPAYDAYTRTGDPAIAEALDAMFREGTSSLVPTIDRYRRPPDLTPGAEVDNAHVVEFLECTTPWAVGYLWTGDETYLKAALGWHELLDRVAMQPHGVPVADEWYLPTGAFRGSETCDVAGYLWSQLSLLSVTGDGRMADRAERALFNAGPATVSRDFKTHVYFQSPNRFAAGSPTFPHGPGAGGGVYKAKHDPLCCTAALNRIIPWYATSMWMATNDDGLAATCYGPCKLTALAGERVPVEITCETDYPFNETIAMTVKTAHEASFPISFRIPGWCETPGLFVNDEPVAAQPSENGFVRIERTWKPGDRVRLHLPMTPRLQQGRDAAPRGPFNGVHAPTRVSIPAKDDLRGLPYATVSYGPLLFALAIADLADPNTPDPAARWKFALDEQQPRIEVVRSAMPTKWDWPLDSPLKLKVQAVAVDWNPSFESPMLPAEPFAKSGPSEAITLVPYGCSKFRIAMFPVAAEPEVRVADVRKILFLGNSITHHGPKPDIDWAGDWGMAATAPEKDYVHLVAAAIGKHTGKPPEILVRNIAEFEREYATYDVDAKMKDLVAFDADLVVLAIGENVPALASDEAADKFHRGVVKILAAVRSKRRPIVVVRSGFWADEAKDRQLRKASDEAGTIYVDAGPLGRDEANAARSERPYKHAGVGGHPGDRGMKALADLIVKAVLARAGEPGR
ncbi:beta-L-arabinofuranosidase domain-containing protein [Paludisphaera mucosa]|uniref:Glycoside hydrolase family 127 protein n=1 Tax=Paludisphaera mucosa TaxID=3030827 RepID=A0ABT6FFC5_9BACT|nr:beta-L-arabinofuranosidase domain-containing protein [Paludisphaera mucosa]MDG3006278.1 glycoside hydrolase family 127 protein [Paludisphaera mucosa]